MTTPNNRSGERPVWKRGWKRAMTVAEHSQRVEAGKKGGKAVMEKYGREHFVALREKGGGRPTFAEWVREANEREASGMSSRSRSGRGVKKEVKRFGATLPGE